MNLYQMMGVAGRLSDQQIAMAMRSGTLPEFVGMAELHMRNEMRGTPEPPPLRDELMARAMQPEGMNAGGLVRVHDTRPRPLGGERRYFGGFTNNLAGLPPALNTAITGSPGTTSPLVATDPGVSVASGAGEAGGWDGNPNSGPGRDGNPDSKPGTGNVVNDLSGFTSSMRDVIGYGPLAQTAMGFMAGGIPGAIAGGVAGMIGGLANVAGGRAVSAASEALGGRPTNATGTLGSISQALGFSGSSDGRAKGEMDPSIQGNAEVTGDFDKPSPSNVGASVSGAADGSAYGKEAGIDGGSKADFGGGGPDISGHESTPGIGTDPMGGGFGLAAGGAVQVGRNALARIFGSRLGRTGALVGAGGVGYALYPSDAQAPDAIPLPPPEPPGAPENRRPNAQAGGNDALPLPPPSPPGESRRDDPIVKDSQRNGLSPIDIALIQLGLGMMGSNRATPLAAMSEAANPALRTYVDLINAEERREDRAQQLRETREWRDRQEALSRERLGSQETLARERLNRTAGRATAAPRPRAGMTDEQWRLRIATERDPDVRQRLIEERAISRGAGEGDRLGMRTP